MSRFNLVAPVVFVGLLVQVSVACGQAAPAQAGPAVQNSAPAPTLVHANANLVLVDVVVTDHGKAVHGLERSRFHLFENGKELPISAFDEHRPAAAPADAAAIKAEIAALPAHTYTNVPVYPDAGVVNVLLLDALNTPMANQAEARRQMIEYMGNIAPGTSLAIFTLSSQLRLVEGFTTDAARLANVLKGKTGASSQSALLNTEGSSAQTDVDSALAMITDDSNGEPNQYAVAALQQFEADLTATQTDMRVRLTMDSMQQLARSLSAIPGRKNLIWFSGSFPISIDPDPDQPLPFLNVRNYADEIKKTSELLTAARVAVYPVDARGMMTQTTADAAYSPNATRVTVSSGGKLGVHGDSMNDSNVVHDYDTFMTQTMEEHGSMQQIAEETGGVASFNNNDLKGAVGNAVDNGSSYYTIAFAPGGKKLDGRFRRIQVRLDNGNYILAYRRGYYADPPENNSAKPSEHNQGQASALDSASLHGAPSATQVLFLARVLPSTDPAFQGISMAGAPAGEMGAQLKGPTQRFLVDLTVDAHSLVFNNDSSGFHQAQVEFVLLAYDADGKRLNYVDRSYAINIKPQEFEEKMNSGIRGRLALDVPAGHQFLRVAVQDLLAGHAGSLEVPLNVIAK